MRTFVKNRRPAPDRWKLLNGNLDWLRYPAEDGLLPDLPPGDLIVPVSLWHARKDDLIDRATDPRTRSALGVWLNCDDDPASVATELAHFALVAVDFTGAADAHGHTIARLLRERYGYTGELRAMGGVAREQLFYLARCGFDSFELRDEHDDVAARGAINDVGEACRDSAERPVPLFRRRRVA